MEYATILSIPLGPNDVRTASLIAVRANEIKLINFNENTNLLPQPCWTAAVPLVCPVFKTRLDADRYCKEEPTLSLKEALAPDRTLVTPCWL